MHITEGHVSIATVRRQSGPPGKTWLSAVIIPTLFVRRADREIVSRLGENRLGEDWGLGLVGSRGRIKYAEVVLWHE